MVCQCIVLRISIGRTQILGRDGRPGHPFTVGTRVTQTKDGRDQSSPLASNRRSAHPYQYIPVIHCNCTTPLLQVSCVLLKIPRKINVIHPQ